MCQALSLLIIRTALVLARLERLGRDRPYQSSELLPSGRGAVGVGDWRSQLVHHRTAPIEPNYDGDRILAVGAILVGVPWLWLVRDPFFALIVLVLSVRFTTEDSLACVVAGCAAKDCVHFGQRHADLDLVELLVGDLGRSAGPEPDDEGRKQRGRHDGNVPGS